MTTIPVHAIETILAAHADAERRAGDDAADSLAIARATLEDIRAALEAARTASWEAKKAAQG